MKQYLLILILVVYSSAAYCCSCIGEATVKQELKRSDVVFIGKVMSKKIIDITDTLMPAIIIQNAEYKLRVLTVFKGKIKQDTVMIGTVPITLFFSTLFFPTKIISFVRSHHRLARRLHLPGLPLWVLRGNVPVPILRLFRVPTYGCVYLLPLCLLHR